MTYIDIVFDGPPSHESGRFVEVENAEGRSINAGEWLQRADGYWVLRIKQTQPVASRGKANPSSPVSPTPEERGCDDAEVMRIWRECGLPEYFLGNGGSNHKLVAFAKACALKQAADVAAEDSK